MKYARGYTIPVDRLVASYYTPGDDLGPKSQSCRQVGARLPLAGDVTASLSMRT